MRKKYRNVLVIVFVIFIFGFFIINIFNKDMEFSNLENRSLAKMPTFKIDRLIEGRYTKNYEKYKNDQFFMRDTFIILNMLGVKLMRKKYRNVLAIVFVIFIFGFFIINIFNKDMEFSNLENRSLAKMPTFKIDRLIEGRYTKNYEKYKNDQFFMRDTFIKLKSEIDVLLGKKENNNIYLCSDGYLIEKFLEPNKESLEKNIRAINEFSNKHSEIKINFMMIPNAISIYNEKLPRYVSESKQVEYINNFSNKLDRNISFINPYNYFIENKEEEIFYRADHHWTTKGAYYGYLALCDKMNLKKNEESYYDIELVSNDFKGTLYSRSLFDINKEDEIKVYIPKNEDDEVIVNQLEEKKVIPSLYDSLKLGTNDKYGVFLGGNKPIIKIQTTAKYNKKLLLIKDSYANSIVQFLTPYFEEIVMVDPRYYYGDIEELIKEEKFSETLFLYNANTFFQDNSLYGVLENY